VMFCRNRGIPIAEIYGKPLRTAGNHRLRRPSVKVGPCRRLTQQRYGEAPSMIAVGVAKASRRATPGSLGTFPSEKNGGIQHGSSP